jgi:hypothetical protein
MATYRWVQLDVHLHDGFVPKTCWIADVRRHAGLPTRVAPNRHSAALRNPCPPSKVAAIRKSLVRAGDLADDS